MMTATLSRQSTLRRSAGTCRDDCRHQAILIIAGALRLLEKFISNDSWMALQNTGTDDIHLIFIYSAPGFEQYMRCTSISPGATTAQLSIDQLRDCASRGNVEYEGLSATSKK